MAVERQELEIERASSVEGQLLARKGEEPEQGYLEQLRAEGHDILEAPSVDWRSDARTEEAAAATERAMREGRDVIYQACFVDGQWRGFADFLLRVDNVETDLGPWGYEAADAESSTSRLTTRATPAPQRRRPTQSPGSSMPCSLASGRAATAAWARSARGTPPATPEFLFSRNRLDVAISRARRLAFVVYSPRLLDAPARSVDEMRLINALCLLVETATDGSTSSPPASAASQ